MIAFLSRNRLKFNEIKIRFNKNDDDDRNFNNKILIDERFH